MADHLIQLLSSSGLLVFAQICGESNCLVFREAAAAGLQRAAFVSVHDYNVPGIFTAGCAC